MRCLLVDDDAAIRTLVTDYLAQHGITVQALRTGAEFRRRMEPAEAPGPVEAGGSMAAPDVDLVLLDLMLPDDDGLALCPWVKRLRPALPVIMLTAQGDPISRVLGLELGADDYLAKPFEPRELVARIRAVLRRGQALAAAAVQSTEVRFAGWHFDRLRRQLQAPDGTLVALSAAELRLLNAFVDHPGRVLSRERLLALTRAPGVDASDRSIDLAVSRLRAKLGDATPGAPLIRTLRGEGYCFDGPLGAGPAR